MHKNYFTNPQRRTFLQAFPKFKRDEDESNNGIKYFWECWQESFFSKKVTLVESDLENIYYHLRAHYYNWHYIYPDTMGIIDNTMKIIEEYYPNVKERLALADELRQLTLDEFKKSSINLQSNGQNPKKKHPMDEFINLVDAQNVSVQFKSQEQVIRAKYNYLFDGVMDEFIERFSYQFVKLYNGVSRYNYMNPIDGEFYEELEDGDL